MTLDLGTLNAYISIDDREFGKGLDRGERRFGGFSKKILAASAFVGVGIGTSVVKNLNLEPARDKLAAQLGLSEADSAKIGKIAGGLYAENYGDSLSDVNGAIAAVMSSIDGMGVSNGKALQGAAVDALNFAKTFDSDVPRAVQIAGQAIKNGLAKDSEDAFDLITAASQRVPVALQADILDAVDEYGPAFAQIGFTGQQAFAMLVESSEKGAYGIDKAGDAIKEFTIRSTDMSTGSKAAYEAIGLDAGKMANAILAGGDSAQAGTQKAIKGLLAIKDPAKQANAAIALFGTPLEDLNTSEIPAFLKSMQAGSDAMDGYGGAGDRMGKTLNENASTSLGELKRRGEMAFLALGNGLLPAINAVSGAAAANLVPALIGVGAAIDSVVGFIEDHDTAAKIIVGTITVLLLPALVAWGVQALISAGKATAAWLMSKISAIGSATVQILVLTLMTAGWIAAATQATLSAARIAGAWLIAKVAAAGTIVPYAITFAFMAAGWIAAAIQATASALLIAAAWLIALGPIGLVILAIAALVFFIVKNWDTIKEKTKEAWDWVVDKVEKVWNKIKEKVSDGADSVVSFMRGLPGRIKSAVGGLFDGIKDAFKSALNWIIGKWNNFSLKIGGGSFMGKTLPSVTLNTPDIPMLANGGLVKAQRGGTLAVLAEAGEDEWAVPESKADAFARSRLSGNGYEGLGYPTSDRGPLIGAVYQTPGQSADDLAEMLWRKTRARG